MDDQSPGLQRAKTYSEIFSAVVLPFVLAGIGYYFTTKHDAREESIQQDQKVHEEQRQDLERITQLMDRLTSSNPDQRTMALIILQNYANNCNLGRLIVPAVLYGIQNQQPQVKKAASDALAIAAQTCPEFKQQIKVALASSSETRGNFQTVAAASPVIAQLVPRVYIHIRDESQRGAAQEVQKALENKNFVVPGIEKVNTGPTQTDLRYFDRNDQNLASSVVAALPMLNAKAIYVSGYENSPGIRPHHLELWFAPGPVQFRPGAQDASSLP